MIFFCEFLPFDISECVRHLVYFTYLKNDLIIFTTIAVIFQSSTGVQGAGTIYKMEVCLSFVMLSCMLLVFCSWSLFVFFVYLEFAPSFVQVQFDPLTICYWLFSKAISIFEHDERFKAVERAKDREDLFEDYMEELEKKVNLLPHS